MELKYETFGDAARLVRITNTTDPISDYLREMIDRNREAVLKDIWEQEELKLARGHPGRPVNPLQRALEDIIKQPANRSIIDNWEAWGRERKAYLNQIKSAPRKLIQAEQPRFADVLQPREAGAGELIWAETNFILPNKLGLTLFPDGQGLRLSGQLGHSSGDLWSGSLVVFSWFGLSRDRMPPGSGTRFRSSPSASVTGEVIGFTGGGSIFSGDQWSKCWLQPSQVVHQGSQSFPAWSQPWTLLFIADDLDYDTNFLPGFFFYPPIDFDLNRQLDVAVYTGLKFDFQPEGDSEFRFGGVGHMNPSLFQPSQWTLQPL